MGGCEGGNDGALGMNRRQQREGDEAQRGTNTHSRVLAQTQDVVADHNPALAPLELRLALLPHTVRLLPPVRQRLAAHAAGLVALALAPLALRVVVQLAEALGLAGGAGAGAGVVVGAHDAQRADAGGKARARVRGAVVTREAHDDARAVELEQLVRAQRVPGEGEVVLEELACGEAQEGVRGGGVCGGVGRGAGGGGGGGGLGGVRGGVAAAADAVEVPDIVAAIGIVVLVLRVVRVVRSAGPVVGWGSKGDGRDGASAGIWRGKCDWRGGASAGL